MTTWLLTGWQILVLRLGPQDLPGRVDWTVLAAALYLASGALLLHGRGMDERMPAMLLVDLFLIAAFVMTVLRLMGRPERVGQSLQAIFLAGMFLHLLAWPFAPVLASPPEEGTLWLDVAVTLTLALVFWGVALLAHILRHALELGFAPALLLSLGYTLMNLVITYHVFPLD